MEEEKFQLLGRGGIGLPKEMSFHVWKVHRVGITWIDTWVRTSTGEGAEEILETSMGRDYEGARADSLGRSKKDVLGDILR